MRALADGAHLIRAINDPVRVPQMLQDHDVSKPLLYSAEGELGR
jgi:hypothetical protein